MKRCFFSTLVALLLAGEWLAATALAQAPPPPADASQQQSDALTQLYSQGANAFAAGDYKTAAELLEKVVAQAPPEAKIESVYFTLGAAYYNQEQYPKAIEAFKKYQSKYPNGAKLAEATFSLGQAYLQTKNYGEAAETFKKLENTPAYREQALLAESRALKELNRIDDAIATLQKLTANGIRTENAANGAMLLAGLLAQKGQTEKSAALIEQVRQNLALVDNVMQVNSLAVELGDSLLKNKQPREALAIYRSVRTRDEVIRFQQERLATIQRQIEQNLAAMRADPMQMAQLVTANKELKTAQEEGKELLANFQKLPDFAPSLLFRLATCFYQLDKRWESIVVYEELLSRYPDDPSREATFFGLIVASVECNRIDKARQLAEQYLRDFNDGPNAGTVGYLLGASALQANDPQAAETYFGRLLREQAKSPLAEETLFLLGNARFALTKYDEARKDYEKYCADYSKGTHVEEANYRIALGSVFAGAYEKAMGQLNDYLKKYPSGEFAPDAKYRLALCRYAASLYDEVIADCRAWQKQYGQGGQLLGEVLSLEADAMAQKGNDAEAADVYIRAYKVATSDEVMNYALFAAQKLLQKAGKWEQLGQMFREFVRDHPENPTAVTAVYWIGKADVRAGKVEEAKQFIAETVKKYLGDPKRDAVEQLLSQLVQLCVRKKPAAPPPTEEPAAEAGASVTPAAVAAATPAPTPDVDPGAELDRLLGGAEASSSPTAQARVLFAKAELARLRKQTAEQEKNFQAIANGFKPADLSSTLLAQVGDFLLSKGQLEQAAPVFQQLLLDYPKSDIVDYAYNGLGEIAYQKKDYATALRFFTDAIDKVGATTKLKDVTVGRAKTLLALKKFDEAKKLFEQAASVREWRGETTAFAVYSLGEIAQQQGKWAEAIAYYQRVYVAYQRFLPWVAKAYVQSAECFKKLGKTQEARNTYQEMLRNEKLQKFGEYEAARQRLQELGQPG